MVAGAQGDTTVFVGRYLAKFYVSFVVVVVVMRPTVCPPITAYFCLFV